MKLDDWRPSRPSVRKRIIWTAGILAVGLVISLYAGRTTSDAPPGEEFPDYVARLRAAGEPTTLLELHGAEPPGDVNGAPEIAAALKWLDDAVGRDDTWTVTGPWDEKYGDDKGPWFEKATPEEIGGINAFLVRIRPFFDRVAAAAEKPKCRFPFTVDGHGMVVSDGVTSIQRLTRVLSARAAVDPDPAARVEACRTLCVLARRYEPIESIGHMVRTVTATIASSALRHGVESGTIDAASARTTLDPLLAPTWLDVHPRFFTTELVHHISEFSAILDGRNPPSPGNEIAPSASATFTRWCEVDHDAAKWPTRPYAAYLRRARATATNARAKGATATVVLPKVADRLGRDEAACRLARVALAVAEHRATRGDFPASLDELKPLFTDGVPLDPYTDAAFVYEKTAGGVRIASLGRLAEDKPLEQATLRERCLVWELKR